MTLAGSHIHEDVAPVGNGDHSDVRSTGGKGFLTSLGRGDAQDGRNDVGVGHVVSTSEVRTTTEDKKQLIISMK